MRTERDVEGKERDGKNEDETKRTEKINIHFAENTYMMQLIYLNNCMLNFMVKK